MGSQISTVEKNKEITFTLHGKKHTVALNAVGTSKVTPLTSLALYLRDYAELRDTKVMCREGGCGACIVTATIPNPLHNKKKTIAVNACLTPVLACHNWEIQTVHGIGNRTVGYHPIQVSLAQHKGSQCGYCSAGMVMNMYALTESRDMLTMQEVEDSFGGNMCRCTGYRPIMDAFKSLAGDADPALKNKYPQFPDIEDLQICKLTKKPCAGMCEKEEIIPLYFDLDEDMHWYKARTIENILDFFRQIGNASYRLVAGNTGQGVYKIIDPPKYWVDIRTVKELVVYSVDDDLVLGANMTLTDTMELFVKLSEENENFWYLKKVRDHLNLVANVPVRNVGTLAGNLTLKHDHPEFPSDIFILLESLDAQITIVKKSGHEVTKSVTEYLNFDMYKCVMKSITLSPIKKSNNLFQSYKIMQRAQNAHAYVNAAFLIKCNDRYKVRSANIVYGGISPTFIHATKTEDYLIKKNLFDNLVLQGVLDTLTEEIQPDNLPAESSPEFRKNLTRNLYYKFFLANAPINEVNPKYQSGGAQLQHELLTGVQFYQTDKNEYPVTEPVDKLEAMIQCSGEAKYIDDMPAIPGEVFGYLVLAEAAPFSKVMKVDITEAMKMPGVTDYVDYKDIPGENVFTNPILNPTAETLFCEGTIEYNGQPLGVIVADTWQHAQAGAQKVKITYSASRKKPEYTIESILKDNKTDRIQEVAKIEPKRRGGNVKKVLKGKYVLPGQYHYHMETVCCVCVPTEDGGYDIYASTQWMDEVHITAARILNMNMDKINVIVRRLGGTFGAKILRGSIVNIASVVTSHKVGKPVRIFLPIDINMKAIGKRYPTYCDYEVGVDDIGVIQYLDSKVYQAVGLSGTNESLVDILLHYIVNTYVSDTFKISCNIVQTDMTGNGFCRSPSSYEATGIIENIMDHIAYATGKSQIDVRKANLLTVTPDMKNVLLDTIQWSDYDKRMKDVQKFNANNRWMKKGLSFTIMNFSLEFKAVQNVFLSVFSGDGSVAITHSGIECGQGINTKVVQVCARQFNIPMSMISIKPSNSFTSANMFTTGGSITSEAATLQACKTILDRLAPIRARMGKPTWPELILEAQQQQIELSTTGFFTAKDLKNYLIPGACVCEVQVDLLTGEYVVQRVDLLEDVGRSISPSIDAGQIEGAFIMGMGNYTCENLLYGDQGELLTYNTWTYKIPGVKDVPQNFRIMFRRDSTNPVGVLNSKATGEPATGLSVGIPIAIRQALMNAKEEKSFIEMDCPFTVECVLQHSSSNYKEYTL